MDNQNLFKCLLSTELTSCIHCGGKKLIRDTRVEDKTSYIQCKCAHLEKIQNWLGSFNDCRTLEASPLLPYFENGRTVILESDDPFLGRSHFRTTCLMMKNINTTILDLNPDSLIKLSYSDQSEQLHKAEYLFETVAAFPHYDVASKRHEYIFSLRKNTSKTTVIFAPNGYEKLMKTFNFSDSLKSFLSSLDKITVRKKDWEGRIKNSAKFHMAEREQSYLDEQLLKGEVK